MSDIFYGTVTLPDGRECKAVVHGVNHPNSWDEPGYFETREHDPLEIESIDGAEPDEAEYWREYLVPSGNRYAGDCVRLTLQEYVIDQLIDHGTFEEGDLDPL